MLSRRIIPCLDVKDGRVVKGVQFRNHRDQGDILTLAQRYVDEGADELVFYDITASCDERVVDKDWVKKIAHFINIPFCVAGGIRTIDDARKILYDGADKISINSPALANPEIISDLAAVFGSQCVVLGIDSCLADGNYQVYQYTGRASNMQKTTLELLSWARQAQQLGVGEIVLNCMNNDGVRQGYDLAQLQQLCAAVSIPVIASGGAGSMQHFAAVFNKTPVSGALAASVFHSGEININELKYYLQQQQVTVRL